MVAERQGEPVNARKWSVEEAAEKQIDQFNADIKYLENWQLFSDRVGTVLIQHRCGHTLDIPASRSAYLSDIVRTVLQQRKEHTCEH
jgi:hypothetical protein